MQNQIFYGDNLNVLRKYIKDESIDLCYIDPPFNSKRNYNQIYNNIGKEDKAQAQAFTDTWEWDDAANEALAHKKDDRVRKEFEKWAVLTYSDNRAMINEKKGGDGGIDGMAYIVHNLKKEIKKIVFSVKSSKTLTPAILRELNGVVESEGAAMGILITLYPFDHLEKDAKKYGVYTNDIGNQKYDKIQIVSIEDIMKGKIMELPYTQDVVKKASKNKSEFPEFDF